MWCGAGSPPTPARMASAEGAASEPEPEAQPRRQPHAMLTPQTFLPSAALEYTVHELPPMLARTLEQWGVNTIGAAVAARGAAEGEARAAAVTATARATLAIPTWQPSELDLTVYPSEAVSKERDRLFVRCDDPRPPSR